MHVIILSYNITGMVERHVATLVLVMQLYINTLSWMSLYHCIVLSIITHYYITWYDIIYSYISHSMVDRHVATLVLVMQHSKVRFFSFCLCITCWWTDKMKPPGVHVLPATLVCFYKRPSRDTKISLS